MGCNSDYCDIEPMVPELKPCPFCGAKAFMWTWSYGAAVECSEYNPKTHQVCVKAESAEDAIEAWNTRAQYDCAIKANEALRKSQEARLLTAQDFEDNPNMDNEGFLPSWVECNEKERETAVILGVIEPGDTLDGWAASKKNELPGGENYNPNVRLWTARPTEQQMKAIPWTQSE